MQEFQKETKNRNFTISSLFSRNIIYAGIKKHYFDIRISDKLSVNEPNHTLLDAFRTWNKLSRSFPDPVCNFVYDQAISFHPGLSLRTGDRYACTQVYPFAGDTYPSVRSAERKLRN